MLFLFSYNSRYTLADLSLTLKLLNSDTTLGIILFWFVISLNLIDSVQFIYLIPLTHKFATIISVWAWTSLIYFFLNFFKDQTFFSLSYTILQFIVRELYLWWYLLLICWQILRVIIAHLRKHRRCIYSLIFFVDKWIGNEALII